MHGYAKTYVSAKAQNVSEEHDDNHLVGFQFLEHILETHGGVCPCHHHFLCLEIHKQLEDEAKTTHYGGGYDIFQLAYCFTACQHTHYGDDDTGASKGYGFKGICKACGAVLFIAVVRKKCKHTL